MTGRDAEIRQMIDILMRRRQNNPILTGEAGVGKTAVVEALALRLAAGDVPPGLKDVQLILLDIGLLKAGASVSGEFESRLRAVMDEVESARPHCALYRRNPYLDWCRWGSRYGRCSQPAQTCARQRQTAYHRRDNMGRVQKYFEKDPALTRRFQVVQVDEPTKTKPSTCLEH